MINSNIESATRAILIKLCKGLGLAGRETNLKQNSMRKNIAQSSDIATIEKIMRPYRMPPFVKRSMYAIFVIKAQINA